MQQGSREGAIQYLQNVCAREDRPPAPISSSSSDSSSSDSSDTEEVKRIFEVEFDGSFFFFIFSLFPSFVPLFSPFLTML